jgi:hypothetical protein
MLKIIRTNPYFSLFFIPINHYNQNNFSSFPWIICIIQGRSLSKLPLPLIISEMWKVRYDTTDGRPAKGINVSQYFVWSHGQDWIYMYVTNTLQGWVKSLFRHTVPKFSYFPSKYFTKSKYSIISCYTIGNMKC